MNPDELLQRVASSLRREIGPAVGEPFAKTQAFMASVVLEKLAGQLRLAEDHARTETADRALLVDDLEREFGDASAPARLRPLIIAVRAGDADALSDLIEALYAERDALGAERFARILTRVRQTLRARLDRQLEYAS